MLRERRRRIIHRVCTESADFVFRSTDPGIHSFHMSDVTQLLNAAAAGDRKAAADLLPLVYGELRKLAAARMASEKHGQTLDATALVHEAYIRLIPPDGVSSWNSRGHFFAAAAEAMRRILVDNARRKQAIKNGGDRVRVEFPVDLEALESSREDLLTLDEVLTKLEQDDPEAARLVKLRYFAGLTHQQVADALGVSLRTADRIWALARTWLFRQMSK